MDIRLRNLKADRPDRIFRCQPIGHIRSFLMEHIDKIGVEPLDPVVLACSIAAITITIAESTKLVPIAHLPDCFNMAGTTGMGFCPDSHGSDS